MENDDVWYDRFMKILLGKFPKKSHLIEALMVLLSIEREAAYRRLRGDVVFSTLEIAKICTTWNISLDSILNLSSGRIPFLMQKIDYLTPSDQELKFLQEVIQGINSLKDFPDTEFMDICNKLPRQLLAGYSHLNQFYQFKCMYQYGCGKKSVPFSQIITSSDKRKIDADYYKAIKTVPNTNFIFDRMLFDHLVDEIRYFHSIMMITDEEKELIKSDLYNLLDYLSEVAANGCYPETHNKVNLYISQLNIDTNYSYTYTQKVNICFVHVFDKYEIHTYDSDMVNNFMKWMQLKKRTSINISGMDEKSRIELFNRQRQIIDLL
jgi:hypothetical protein